ncbi:MAG: hypothetical protein EOP33_09610 [Rickettsiaceae bacterium]|nr:MAG: hypothetical protein EOP33_09610 [Rickettsiaceae bacterium]
MIALIRNAWAENELCHDRLNELQLGHVQDLDWLLMPFMLSVVLHRVRQPAPIPRRLSYWLLLARGRQQAACAYL